MSFNLSEITRDALSLPDNERAHLAQQLWESLNEGSRTPSAVRLAETAKEAAQRDVELTTGAVQPQTHKEAMRAAREAIR